MTNDPLKQKDLKLKKILVIRRDNIGDLVCTTPMIKLLRQHFPDAQVDALANSYNRPTISFNADLNHIYEYTKGKHRHSDESLLSVYWKKIRLFWHLRRTQYDLAILPSGGFNRRALGFANMIGAKNTLGYIENDSQKPKGPSIAVDVRQLQSMHEVEYCTHLLSSIGISGPIPQASVVSTAQEQAVAKAKYGIAEEFLRGGIIGLHISARKPSNRWKEEYYIQLILALWQQEAKPIALFWSPGPADHPQHPGDDELAARIRAACSDAELISMPTEELRELIAGLSLCESVICSDGGAMHLAAGLGKPVVCLFGDSDSKRWHPWGVPFRLLQKNDRQASSVSPEEVIAAYVDLRNEVASTAVSAHTASHI